MSPGYCALKGDVTKINNLFLAPRLFGVRKYLYSIFHCNLIWLHIRLYFFLNKGILIKLSRGTTYKFIFLQLTVNIKHKKNETKKNLTKFFRVICGRGKVVIFRKDFMFSETKMPYSPVLIKAPISSSHNKIVFCASKNLITTIAFLFKKNLHRIVYDPFEKRKKMIRFLQLY